MNHRAEPMPPRLAPAVSALARQTMKTAFDELERTVIPADAREFRTTTLEAVRKAALEVEKRMEAKQALRNMRRLKPLLDGMEHYSKVVDILCNGTPFLPWIWAPITLILRIASEYVEAFELLMKGYARIASNLGRFEKLSVEFLTNPDFQHTLAVYYADILQFHKHAYKFVRRNGWRLLFVTSWGRFQRRFDQLLEDLKRHGELIDAEAITLNIVEAGRIRKEIRQWREESLAQVEIEEEERAMNHFRSVLSWLKSDETEQLSVCDAIFDEGSKYPGTCSWITGHPKIRSWLQQKPDSLKVWFQGNPGTGKSIASGQIVKFIQSSHSMVLRHFCTYSHASSTKYENVLRSLLTQLIRKNGELVAHVYQECVVKKKAPTITLLEQLFITLCASVTDEPGKIRYIWVVLDGVDECESNKQSRLLTLMNQVTSRSVSEGNTVCKVLVSSRPSSEINKHIQRKQTVSLSDEATQLYKSIQMYASQRLLSAIQRLRQLDIEREDIDELAKDVATKADGMFLYARLVLDYVTSNIFYSPAEIRDSINRLPPSLTEFYQTILVQMLKGLDARSVDRIKTILGWVAYAKRPLMKLELLSAVTFGQANPAVDRLVPPYILDICGPLMEERRDATFAFIHVSVKEFLESNQARISISKRSTIREHATATVTALLAGIRIFYHGFEERQRLFQVVRGVHGLHVYATEFWIDYLLSDAALSKGPETSSDIFVLSCRLARELNAGYSDGMPKSLAVQPSDIDERLQLFRQHTLLYDQMKAALNARSRKRLESEAFREHDNEPCTTQDLDTTSHLLTSYQTAVELLLNEESHPGVSAEELENFKSQFRATAFTCRLRSCPRATLGFGTDSLRREHEITHVGGYRCKIVNCQYPPFPSAKSLKRHTANIHNSKPIAKSIRRVGQLGGFLSNSSIASERNRNHRLAQSGDTFNNPAEKSSEYLPIPSITNKYFPKQWEDILDLTFERNIFTREREAIELALSTMIGKTELSEKERAAAVPRGLPTNIQRQLLDMPPDKFWLVLTSACARASKSENKLFEMLEDGPPPLLDLVDPFTGFAPMPSSPIGIESAPPLLRPHLESHGSDLRDEDYDLYSSTYPTEGKAPGRLMTLAEVYQQEEFQTDQRQRRKQQAQNQAPPSQAVQVDLNRLPGTQSQDQPQEAQKTQPNPQFPSRQARLEAEFKAKFAVEQQKSQSENVSERHKIKLDYQARLAVDRYRRQLDVGWEATMEAQRQAQRQQAIILEAQRQALETQQQALKAMGTPGYAQQPLSMQAADTLGLTKAERRNEQPGGRQESPRFRLPPLSTVQGKATPEEKEELSLEEFFGRLKRRLS